MNKLAWDFYAISYENIKHLPAYRKMIEDVYRELEVRAGGVYLDAGCGSGELLKKMLNEKNVKAYGLDFSTLMLKRAFKKCGKDITLIYSDLNEGLKFSSNFFDGIASVHVLYALENPSYILKEFYRILKPNGKLVVCDLKESFSYKPLMYDLMRIIPQEKFKSLELIFHLPILGIFNILQDLEMKKKGKKFFTEEMLKSLIEDAGFSTIRVRETYASQSILISAKKL